MTRRIAGFALFVVCAIAGALLLSPEVHAQTNPIGFPLTTQCPSTAPSLATGQDPAFPGQWWNPNRAGTGWNFFFSVATQQIVIYWLTYDGNGQPVWLFNEGSSIMSTAANGAKQYWSQLYLVEQPPSSTNPPPQTATPVGYVAVAFVPGSTTAAAIRWQWNAVAPLSAGPQPDECVYDYFHGTPPLSANVATTVDESYTGEWAGATGWGISVTEGTDTTGSTTEIDEPLIYDVTGYPVWFLGTASNPPPTATAISIGYARSNYPGGYPTSQCTSGCFTGTPAGTLNRTFTTNAAGTAKVLARVTLPGVTAVTWPNAPFKALPLAITKVTELEYIAVNVTNCVVPAGQTTCPVVVSWRSEQATAQVYKRNLTTNAIAAIPPTTNSGTYTDNLAVGSNVQYELHKGLATGALLYTSAEVKAVAGTTLPALPAPVTDAAPTHDATVGTLAGQAGTDGGAATYSVSIVVPPGRAGMQPSLSLNYNSRNGNGMMGLGWSISGLSSVHRCPQTPEQDGQTLGVSYSANDKLCLDGQRLVLVSGTYGANNSVYQTEINSYARITQLGGDLSLTDMACFRVEQKDGRILHYGGLTTATTCTKSAVHSRVLPGGAPAALSWLVEKIEDRVGNYESFAYLDNGNGEVLPQSITYTLPDAAPALARSVTFSYVDRISAVTGCVNGSTCANDIASSYLAGGLTMQTKALKAIVTQVGTTTERTYTPTYAAAIQSGRLLMASLTECAGTSTPCHPPTQFSYNDGALDYPFTSLSGVLTPPSAGAASPENLTVIGDLDGDGTRESIISVLEADTSTHYFLAQLTGDRVAHTSIDLTTIAPGFSGLSPYVDIDGSGRDSLILLPTGASGPVSFAVWTAGRGVIPGPGVNPFTTINATGFTINNTIVYGGQRVFTADINGDGEPDLLVVAPDSVDCGTDSFGSKNAVFGYINGLSATAGPLTSSTQTVPFTPAHGSLTTSGALFCLTRTAAGAGFLQQTIDHIADFDGNGIPDVYLVSVDSTKGSRTFGGIQLLSYNSTTKAISSTLSSPLSCDATAGSTTDECNWFNGYATRWMDVNGDGLEDFVIARPSTGVWQVRLNLGGGNLAAAITPTGQSGYVGLTASNGVAFNYATAAPVQDVDGDGRPEILVPSITQGPLHDGFALKMCTIDSVTVDQSVDCGNSLASLQAGDAVNAATSKQCAVYDCPENPGSTTLNLPGTGLAKQWAGLPAQKLYQAGLGAGNDNSAYYMAALKFVQTGQNSMSLSLIETPIVERLGGTPSAQQDLFGDGLQDAVTPIGCANIQKTIGTGTYATCSVVGNDSTGTTYGPLTLPDAAHTATSSFGTNFTLYASVNQGVASFGGSPLSTTPPAAQQPTHLATNAPTGSISLGLSSPYIPGVLDAAVNGLSDTATWNFAPLSLAGPTQNGIPLYTINSPNSYVDGRHFFFQSSMPVVTGMAQSNGVASTFGFRSFIYGYIEAIYNHFGRGFQGFHSIVAQTNATSNRVVRTTTTYNQEYPLTGKPVTIQTGVPNAAGTTVTTVRTENNQYECENSSGAVSPCLQGNSLSPLPTGNTVTQTVLQQQTTQDFDLGTGSKSSHASTANTWDIYGNLLTQTVSHVDDPDLNAAFINPHTVATTNNYVYAPNTWWVNQLTMSSVTSSMVYTSSHASPALPDGSLTPPPRTVATKFLWNPDRTLATKTIQSSTLGQESLITYCYPSSTTSGCPTNTSTSYGLPTQVQVSLPALVGTTLSPTRTSKYTYTKDGLNAAADGYFVLTTARDPTESFAAGTTQTATTTHQPSDGQIVNATDPNSVETMTGYDGFGRATSVQYFGHGASFKSPVQIAYNQCNGSSCSGLNLGEEDIYETYAAYKVTTVQAGYPTHVEWYDLLGRQIKTAERGYTGTFTQTRTYYDKLGTVSEKFTPFYNGTAPTYFSSYQYDALNRPVIKISSASDMDPTHQDFVTTYSYSGRQTSIIARATSVACPGGSPANLCMTMTRSTNALGQYMNTVDALNNQTNYWTEPQGHVVAIEDVEGNYTTATYNELGQRTQSSDPDQGSWTFNYDALGELLSQTDARKVVTTVTQRDALGRTKEQQAVPPTAAPAGFYLNETLLDDWAYDPVNGIGQLGSVTRRRGTGVTQASTPVWGESYMYDTAGRVSSTTTTINEGTNVSLLSSTTYDAAGRPSVHAYPSNLAVQTQYAAYGHPGAIANSSSGQIYWEATAMDAWGKVTNELYVDGTAGTIANYQSTGQEKTASWTLAGSTNDALSYTYDSFSNLTTQTRTADNFVTTESYGYDPLQRLISTSRNNGSAAASYNYTASGNISLKSDFGNVYTYAAANTRSASGCGPHAVSNVGTTTYVCDLNGNMYGGSTLNIAYDANNLPRTAVRTGPGTTTTWAYDANGNRDFETSTLGTRYYGPAGYEQLGTTLVHELGPVIVTRVGTTDKITTVVRDRLGSTIDVIDAAAQTFNNTRAYDAFGAVRKGDLSDRPPGTLNVSDTIHGFTQHEHADDVRLIHMGGRIYDYVSGRFLNVDPIIGNAMNSQSLNPYSYIGNNPLSGTDPTGYVASFSSICGAMAQDDGCAGVSVTQVSSPSVTETNNAISSHLAAAYNSPSTYAQVGGNGAVGMGSQGAGGIKDQQAAPSEKGAIGNAPPILPERPSQSPAVNGEPPSAYGEYESDERYTQIPENEREGFLKDARDAVTRKFNSLDLFTTDDLKDKYLHLLETVNVVASAASGGSPALTRYYNGTSGTITFFNEGMVRRVFGDASRPESHGGTVERIARTLTHELRHLTTANYSIPQSQEESLRGLLNSNAHDALPRELDADRFEHKVWDRQGGKIDDF